MHQAKKMAELRHIEYLQSICTNREEYEQLRKQWISIAVEIVET